MLYILATPIGNLNDITLRALETLKNCQIIIAENPRASLKLLHHFEIKNKQLIQFAEPREQKALPRLIEILKKQDACLVTDAGTPGISDPGFRLVRACVENGIKVVPIPGPSAVITALSAAGLPTDRFLFVGFLPRTESKIIKILELGKTTDSTLIFFDSPFRIIKSCEIIAKHYPESKMVVARELTKVYEEFIRGKAPEVLEQLKNHQTIKGEITGLISFK